MTVLALTPINTPIRHLMDFAWSVAFVSAVTGFPLPLGFPLHP